jgi:Ankyrin repeats (3 copies)
VKRLIWKMNRAYNHGSQGDLMMDVPKSAVPKKVSKAPQGTSEQLREAARTGNIEVIKQLVEKWIGDSVLDEADGIGTTALHTAASNGHKQVVEILLAAGADRDAVNIYGQKPYARAQTTAIRELLADPSRDSRGDGTCTLM